MGNMSSLKNVGNLSEAKDHPFKWSTGQYAVKQTTHFVKHHPYEAAGIAAAILAPYAAPELFAAEGAGAAAGAGAAEGAGAAGGAEAAGGAGLGYGGAAEAGAVGAGAAGAGAEAGLLGYGGASAAEQAAMVQALAAQGGTGAAGSALGAVGEAGTAADASSIQGLLSNGGVADSTAGGEFGGSADAVGSKVGSAGTGYNWQGKVKGGLKGANAAYKLQQMEAMRQAQGQGQSTRSPYAAQMQAPTDTHIGGLLGPNSGMGAPVDPNDPRYLQWLAMQQQMQGGSNGYA